MTSFSPRWQKKSPLPPLCALGLAIRFCSNNNYFFISKKYCCLIKYITTAFSPPFTSHEVLSWAWYMRSQWNSELVLGNYEMTFHFNFSSQSLQKIAKFRRENYVKGWWEYLYMVSQKDDCLFLFWDLQHSWLSSLSEIPCQFEKRLSGHSLWRSNVLSRSHKILDIMKGQTKIWKAQEKDYTWLSLSTCYESFWNIREMGIPLSLFCLLSLLFQPVLGWEL